MRVTRRMMLKTLQSLPLLYAHCSNEDSVGGGAVPVPPQDVIVSAENHVGISVVRGTAAGAVVFQTHVRVLVSSGFRKGVPVSYNTAPYNGAVDGVYVLTGTLAPVAPITNPLGVTVTINVWVIPSTGYAWLDFIDRSRVTGGVDNISRLVTAQLAKILAFSGVRDSATLLRTPSWNEDGTYFNKQSSVKSSVASSSWTRFSNGTQFTMYFVFKQLTVDTLHIGPIVDEINISSAATGIGLYVDNRIASGRVMQLYFIIAKGVGGTPVINLACSVNSVVQNAWNAVKIIYDGTNVNIWTSQNGGAFTLVGTQAPLSTFAAGAPGLMHFGNLLTTGSQTGARIYNKHAYFKDSVMSGADLATMDTWAQGMCVENILVIPGNVYLKPGQSNDAGRGLNSAIAPELSGNVGAYIMMPQPTPATQVPGSGSVFSDSYWNELQLGVSQTFESVATQHGFEMRFGYEMNRFSQSCFIVKYGVGGTPIMDQGVYNDWNVTTPTLYTQMYSLTATGLDEIEHVFRRAPVIRGLTIMQGETDAIISGAGVLYQGNWDTWINQFIDDIQAFGYPITKLRIFFWQISSAGGYPYALPDFAQVKAAQADMVNYLTRWPARAVNVKAVVTRTTDDIAFNVPSPEQHYSAAGLDQMGMILFNYFKNFAQE